MKKTIIIAIAFITLCQAADWPAFRGNSARTGYYPDLVGCPSGRPVWRISLGCEIISSPSVVDDILYIGARDSCIYAIDAETGNIRWKYKTDGWVDASPLIDGSRLIAGSRDSTIYVLNKNSGELIGTMRAGVQLSSAAVTSGGEILCGIGVPRGGIGAYSRSSLSKTRAESRWSVRLPQYTYSSPAVYGQAAVVGATNGRLYGIDAGRKDTIWSLATDGVIYLSTPAIDDTTVYFAPGDDDWKVYAISLLTGKILWNSESNYPEDDTTQAMPKKKSARLLPSTGLVKLLWMSPELRKRTIQNLRTRGIELPRKAKTGGLAKKTADAEGEFIPLGGMKTSSVGVGVNMVYVIQKELGYVLVNDSLADYKQQFNIQAFDKQNGQPTWNFGEWRSSPQFGYCSSPVVTKNIVYFGWGEGRIYGLDAQSGEKVWEDSLQGHIISSPAIAKKSLYVATLDGNIYAYSLSATLPGLDFQKSTYCYPNPAKGNVSNIQVYVDRAATLTLQLFNMAEKPVLHHKQQLTAGQKYTYNWNLSDVANGVYFAIIKVNYADGGSDKKILKIAVLH